MAYGQTGSGKTHTLLGHDIWDKALCGMIPRTAQTIFKQVSRSDPETEYTIKCSMFEFYNEIFRDLLTPDEGDIKIADDSYKGIHIPKLSEVCVVCEDELLQLLQMGEDCRTLTNSSLGKSNARSCMVFIMQLNQKFKNEEERRGKIIFVDMPGSERVSYSDITGSSFHEPKTLSQSIVSLRSVVSAIVANQETIPYKDSKLTRFLKESFGGNSKTTVIATCSPHPKNLEETLSTLNFAHQAKQVKNTTKVNIKQSPETYQKIIAKLKQDLQICRQKIKVMDSSLDISRQSVPRSPMRNKTISLASFDSKSQDSDLDPEYSFGSGTADSRYVDLDKFVALRNQYDSKIADLNKK